MYRCGRPGNTRDPTGHSTNGTKVANETSKPVRPSEVPCGFSVFGFNIYVPSDEEQEKLENEEGKDGEDDDLLDEPEVAVGGSSSKLPSDKADAAQVTEVEKIDPKADSARHRYLPHPGNPTSQELAQHRASGHVEYRSWCPSCVRARGLTEQHGKSRNEPTVSVFSFDYLFINEVGEVLAQEVWMKSDLVGTRRKRENPWTPNPRQAARS